jgi:hypothetical protein
MLLLMLFLSTVSVYISKVLLLRFISNYSSSFSPAPGGDDGCAPPARQQGASSKKAACGDSAFASWHLAASYM